MATVTAATANVKQKVKQNKTSLPHIEWLDIERNGVLHEIAVMKRDDTGTVHFIRVEDLDQIDRKRLLQIVTDRNARNFPLWDLMAQRTLGNGMNALEYFHQLVKVQAPSGEIFAPSLTRRGVALPGALTQRPRASKKG